MNTLTKRDGNFLSMHLTNVISSNTLIDFDSRDEALVTIRDNFQDFDAKVHFKTLRDCHPEAYSSLYIPSDLRKRFENIIPFHSGSEGCLWSVEEGKQQFVLKIYRENIHSNANALACIAKLQHKNLVALREWGTSGGKTYEVLEKVNGHSIEDLMGTFYDVQLKKILEEISEALHCLHENSIIHADVKPENILFDTNDTVTKLCDYGLCAKSETNSKLPRQGRTPMFSAPEVESGSIVFKSDFYSLGMTILYALTSLTDLTKWQEWSGFDESKTNWRELFNGLLEENIEQRWGFSEIQNWIESQNHKEEVNSSNFKNSRELAHHLAINWAEMISKMFKGSFDAWMREKLIELNISQNIMNQSHIEDNDIYLLRIIYSLDPAFEPQYKEYKINANNLLQISQKANEEDLTTQILLQEIYDKKIISELYELTAINELINIHETWVKQVDDYTKAVSFVELKNGEVGMFNKGRDIAELYIRREAKYDYEITWNNSNALCYIWVNYLVEKSYDGNGYGLVASLITDHYGVLLEDNLRVSLDTSRLRREHDSGESSFLSIWQLLHSARTFLRARRNLITPDMHVNATAVLYATNTPIMYTLCTKQLHIGNRVKLSWNISNSILNYITEIGFVDDIGEYELSISETKVYTLYSFDIRGNYKRCEVSVEVIKLNLCPMIKLNMKEEELEDLFQSLSLSEKLKFSKGNEMFKQLRNTANAIELFKVNEAGFKKIDLVSEKKNQMDSLKTDSIEILSLIDKGHVSESSDELLDFIKDIRRKKSREGVFRE